MYLTVLSLATLRLCLKHSMPARFRSGSNLYGSKCPQGHLWQEPGSQDGTIGTFLGALRQLIESPAPFKAVRLEIDGGQVEEPDAEGRNE